MTTNKKTTAVGGKNIGTGATTKENFDLSTIRENFEGMKKFANQIPEGKQRTAFLNGIEHAYVNLVSWAKSLTAAEPVSA